MKRSRAHKPTHEYTDRRQMKRNKETWMWISLPNMTIQSWLSLLSLGWPYFWCKSFVLWMRWKDQISCSSSFDSETTGRTNPSRASHGSAKLSKALKSMTTLRNAKRHAWPILEIYCMGWLQRGTEMYTRPTPLKLMSGKELTLT